jgi:hypothetical protein
MIARQFGTLPPTSISDKMFDAMVRFATIAILVREYPQDIMIYLTKEFSK